MSVPHQMFEPIRYDFAELEDVRRRVDKRDETFVSAMDALVIAAERAVNDGPFSVMAKQAVPPSGDKHDYMSLGTYWWPDPAQPDGVPYIRRDGERNPEIDRFDRQAMETMSSTVETLALAAYFTGDEHFAERAAHLLRIWFLNEDTCMHPHLRYGQGIPGICDGRGIGIIDTHLLFAVMDAISLLKRTTAWTAADQRGMINWFDAYLTWLLTSDLGKSESGEQNNHGTWYDTQVAGFAFFIGKNDIARDVLTSCTSTRFATQILPDGSQPHELQRTLSFNYSVFNLTAMVNLAVMGARLGPDLWHFHTTDGRCLQRAFDWLLPFLYGRRPWTYQQIHAINWKSLLPLYRHAAVAYGVEDYRQAAQYLGKMLPCDDRMVLLYP
ncbi:MAG TPA: alginate lyase family protein [Armatimonadota bacterium]|nr:alginate lyase family protein [Armatimonadota bacterium]